VSVSRQTLVKERYNMRIAIVDDSSSVRMMISLCLEDLEVKEDEVFEFPSAIEAVEDFSNNYYDLIFCDLNMPEMDGYDLVKAIYEKFPHFESSRIIMVSGEEDASYKKILKEFDVHHFIKKPIQPPIFIHHIKPLVEKAKRKHR